MRPLRWFSISLAVTVLVVGFAVVCWVFRGPDGIDFLELSLLSRYALTHGSPYHTGATGEAYVAVGALAPESSHNYPGFIYPPALILVMAPLAFMSRYPGSAVWFAILTLLSVVTVFCLARRWVAVAALAVFFGSGVTQPAFLIGQTAMVVAVGVAVGVAATDARRYWLAALAWGLIAVKPQLGVPFLLVAYAQSGWRGVARAVVGAVFLTVLGATLTGEPLKTMREYFPHASADVYRIGYNLVTNDQIVSWNRALYTFTGYEFNLSPVASLLGYAVVAVVAWWRGRAAGNPWSVSYWLAVSGVAALACGQAKGYDMVLLILCVPHFQACWEGRRRVDLVVFLVAVAVASIPRGLVEKVADPGSSLALVMLGYRTWVTQSLAVWLLVRSVACTYGMSEHRAEGRQPYTQATT